ncbi:MAG: hypothetical protein K0R20_2068 [Actinomycetia bacterium]|nr:hypothetical protein [Actinomycetes bacterium]
MNCDAAQLVLSARMDGDRVAARQAAAAKAHAETCTRCRTFGERSARIRSAVRIRAAEPVPDLVEPIMAAVARERVRPTVPLLDERRIRPRRTRRPRHRRRATSLAPAAAAAVAGLVLGSVLVGGPWQNAEDRPIAAAAVVRNVRTVAPTLDAFHGTYTIHEFGLSREVPERLFDMKVAFRSPQRFRLDVRDRTIYPSRSWTPTHLRFIQDVTATFTSGPSGCPGDLPARVCPRTRAAVTHLSEFSAAAPLPADLVLPVTTFGSTTGFEVLGSDRIGDRNAIRVRLSFERAAPMFPFLRMGGTWRPFFDRDPVLLWLDARSSLPLRMLVQPSRSPERTAWELRHGLGVESPDEPILDVQLVSVSAEPPSFELFRIPGVSAEPTAPRRLEDLPDRIGYLPATPEDRGDLELVSIVLPPRSAPAAPSSMLVYAEGLDYLKIGERRDRTGPEPFGPLDPGAQQILLDGGGVAYYEPAGEGFGRRLAIHAEHADVFLETNLPRGRLLEIASSLPLVGRPLPPDRRGSAGIDVERIDVAEGLTAAGLPASLARSLPGGYIVASAERSTVGSALEGVTLHLRQIDTDTAGEPLTLHVERDTGLPLPSSSEQGLISFAGLEGRWTPSRSELEWVDRGVYHSLQGVMDLRSLIEIAGTIVAAETEAG